ncbi:hypothetical protein RHGRI_001290 [Rhododendron griersonianum]|uniref:RING-type domain-containing protein n=1 Tax=Rhododendron griersonianum TaxID=479676 RepID=A0AAV6LM46_9ERIC|nr:hypothetical protein RHGRI_001290 [Rhododendron griersonianum]
MGSSTSRLERRPSDCRPNRTRRLLSSLICGSSTSQSPSEMEEYADKSLISSVENFPPASDESRCSCTELSARPDSESGSDDTKTEVGASSGSSAGSFEDNFAQYGLRNDTEVSNPCKTLSESKESVSHQVKQQYLESVSANSSENQTVSVSPEDINSGSVIQEHPSENQQVGNNENSVVAPNTSASGSLSVISDSVLSLQWFGDYNNQLAIPTDQDLTLRTGGLLQVDVVSISSNILSSSIAEISNREARRNSRRLFWDALSRRSFRRHNNDSPTIVFTTGHADDLGSHDRWLLDLSGDLHYDGVSRESEYFGSRRHRRNERRRQLRSEISERIRGGLDEGGRQTTFCASGIHPDGTCSCDSLFMGEESSTFASISRIVMLSEALFEVLDEIHRQPLSLSLSMLSVPAPESVVNLFPVKSHKRSCATESESSDVEQCYICLVEYEEGDKIRVLPCHHEYHMLCVDKWLKEIHGVCPLCRHNVCEGVNAGSTSNAEIPS